MALYEARGVYNNYIFQFYQFIYMIVFEQIKIIYFFACYLTLKEPLSILCFII